MQFKTLISIFIGIIIGVFLVGYVFASLAGPDYGPATPGSLCLIDEDTWVFCDPLHTFGDASESIYSINTDELIVGSGGITTTGIGMFGLVGINDSTPEAVLEVTTNSEASAYFMVSSNAAGDGDYFIVDSDGNVGIGTTSPDTALHIAGTSATDIGKFDIGIDFNPVIYPASIGIELLEQAGNIDAGVHRYYVTYYTALGETQMRASTPISITAIEGTHEQVEITIPISTDYRVIGRKIYRTLADLTYYSNTRLLVTIANNTETSYTDNKADAELTGTNYFFRANTTSKFISVNETQSLFLSTTDVLLGYAAGRGVLENDGSSENVMIGVRTGYYITTSAKNVLLGYHAGKDISSGDSQVAIGHSALGKTTTGSNNVAIGRNADGNSVTGSLNTAIGTYALNGIANNNHSGNTAIGYRAGFFITTGSSNIYLGTYSGYNQTSLSNRLIIDNRDRGSAANEITKSLIYGVFDADPANQTLTFNAKVGIGTDPAYALDVQGATGTSTGARFFYDADSGDNRPQLRIYGFDNAPGYDNLLYGYLQIGRYGKFIIGTSGDTGVTFNSNIVINNTNEYLVFPGTSTWKLGTSSANKQDRDNGFSGVLQVNPSQNGTTSRSANFIFSRTDSDYDHPYTVNPTFIIQSGTTVDNKYLKFYHDQTDANIKWGTGSLLLTGGNVGINTSSPDTKLQVVGDSKFGDDNTNYLSISSTGVLTLTGTARVTKEIVIGAGVFHKGVSAPDDVYLSNNIFVLAFDKTADQHAHFTMIIPTDFAAGTDIEIQVDWSFDIAEADHYMTWGLEYLLIADGEDPAGAVTTRLQKTVISTGNNDKQIHTTFATGITGAEADEVLLIRFYRDADHATDDDLDQDAWLMSVHLHYTADKLGE